MGKISAMMDIGKRSMMNSQSALQTTAHNIANKTTEGYSRQRVDITTAPPVADGRLQLGMGTRAAMVTRTNNPFLEKQLQVEQGIMGFHEGQSEALARVEQVFNEQQNKGVNQYMGEFFNTFRELSNNPESVTTRTMVKESAVALAGDFIRVNDQLDKIQTEIDLQVKHTVQEINQISKEISSLNERIATIEISGATANDERDRRDVLVKHLQEKIDVRVAEGDQGMLKVSTAGNAILVSGVESRELSVGGSVDNDRTQVYFKADSTPAFDVTSRIKGGTLGGVLQVRDKIIPEYKQNIDKLAFTFANEVNSIHSQGFDRHGRPGDVLFDIPNQEEGASRMIQVSDAITGDVTRIAAGSKPNAPGDNTTANVISMLEYKTAMDDNSTTMVDFYNSQVGRIGVMASRANKSKESQENILNQMNTVRESISGVSMDEEATKMIEFQKGFDASARLIRTADEMFDTILNLKRM